jgi:hypothetical protein
MWWEDKRERKLDETRGMVAEDLRNTPEELQRVALMKTLRDNEGFDVFRAFATRSEAQFRVDFWVRVEKFRQMDPEANPQKFVEEVTQITELFIAPAAILPSLSTAQRQRVLDAQIIGSDQAIGLNMFDEARKVVTDQLAFGTFARFAGHRMGRAYLRRRFLKPPIVIEDKWEKQEELKKKKRFAGDNALAAAMGGVDAAGVRVDSESELSSDGSSDLMSTTDEDEEVG